MSAVLLAVYDDYGAAERVRVELVRDGFPTDRVELTAECDLGRAALEPAESLHDKYLQYFRTLFGNPNEETYAEMLTDRVEHGAATVAVHPRGTIETARAAEILEDAGPVEIMHHDLQNQSFEHAAAKQDDGLWLRHIWVEASPDTDCIYCRLFPGHTHT